MSLLSKSKRKGWGVPRRRWQLGEVELVATCIAGEVSWAARVQACIGDGRMTTVVERCDREGARYFFQDAGLLPE